MMHPLKRSFALYENLRETTGCPHKLTGRKHQTCC
jgi:hypothetical protein